jgi:hypothetical protein
MSGTDQGSPRFTERQVSGILKRAAEIQSARSETGIDAGTAVGFSLAQLQQAAAELGIEADAIAEAAAELSHKAGQEGRSSIWGGPATVVLERIVEGSVSQDTWPEVLRELRNASGLVGTTTQVGRSFEWNGRGTDSEIHVTVTPEKEHSALRVTSSPSEWGIAIYVLAGMGWLLGSVATSTALGWPVVADLGLAAGLFGTTYLAARSGFEAICRRKGRYAQGVMQALVAVVARTGGSASQPHATVSPAPDLEELQLRRQGGSAV